VGVTSTASVDGRELRRLKNHQAIIDAIVTLTLGGLEPKINDVAHEANLSSRSIYRHFDSLEDANRAASAQIAQIVYGHLDTASGNLDPTPPLRNRCASLVAARVRLHDTIGGLVRNLSRRGPSDIRETAEYRAALKVVSNQAAVLFAPEFQQLLPDDRVLAQAMISALTSFEIVDQLLLTVGVSRAEIAESLTQQVFTVFEQHSSYSP
jgi:AcrR family transcriptional regulator